MYDLTDFHIQLIKKGLRAAEEGKFVSHVETNRLIVKMARTKKGSTRNVRKARKTL